MATELRTLTHPRTSSTGSPLPRKRVKRNPNPVENDQPKISIPSTDVAMHLNRLKTSSFLLNRLRKRVLLKRKYLDDKLIEHRNLHPDVRPRGLKGGHARKALRLAEERGVNFKSHAEMDEMERAYDDHVHDHESWLRGRIDGLSTVYYMTEGASVKLWQAVDITRVALDVVCKFEAGEEDVDDKGLEIMARATAQLPRTLEMLADVEETLFLWGDII